MLRTCLFVYILSAVMGKLKEVKGKSSQHSKPKKQKSKTWKKGHSCASNPETTKFRQAAKERLFTVNVGMLLKIRLSCRSGCLIHNGI